MNRQLAIKPYQPALAVIINSFQHSNENSFQGRKEDRINLLSPMIMRISSLNYQQEVATINISANGASIILPAPLAIGSRVIINAFRDFSALAVVRHSTRRPDGSWAIGLKFIKKLGTWVV